MPKLSRSSDAGADPRGCRFHPRGGLKIEEDKSPTETFSGLKTIP